MKTRNMDNGIYYGDYLQLDKILDAQFPESDKAGVEAHDEMLFIVVHQAYELWFKLILHELTSVAKIMGKPEINDYSPDLQTVVHRLERVNSILDILVQQVSVVETMTPLDFLDFRDLLKPASGFQSYQFKLIEAVLGLKLEARHGREYYLSQLRDEHKEIIAEIERNKSFIELLNDWLERIPFFDEAPLWTNFEGEVDSVSNHPYWTEYRKKYTDSLSEQESANLKRFDQMFFDPEFTKNRRLSHKANQAALFIMLYRDYPVLYTPYKILNALLDVDELMSTWRYRHMNMVHRMIGTRVGTGGSTGKDYLKASLDKHYIFKEIAEITSYLIERKNLPKLSRELESRLGYSRK